MNTTETNAVVVDPVDQAVEPMQEIIAEKPITGRIIGISHRIKQKKDQEPRPTLIAISNPTTDDVQHFKLETEQDELDFLNGICPIKWKPITVPSDNISAYPEHQVVFRSAKDEDILVDRHSSQCHYEIKKGKKEAPDIRTLVEVATDVPSEYIGVQRKDTVAMILGGSGDYFAHALSRKLSEMDGMVLRIPPFKLKEHRGEASKDDDCDLLVKLAIDHRSDFYQALTRDRSIIRLRNAYLHRMNVMGQRIACEQRIAQLAIGDIFCRDDGYFPEGSLLNEVLKLKASSPVLLALEQEEGLALKNLEKAVQALDIFQEVFAHIPGCGPRITAGLMSAIVDIRRFKTAAKLVKYLGAHVLPDGTFPRRRIGQTSNWDPDGRQEVWNIGGQFLRQINSDTKWGNYLKKMKIALRAKHPDIVEVVVINKDGKKAKVKRYTNGHIQKMATWRTLTRFTESLWTELWKLEKSAKASPQG